MDQYQDTEIEYFDRISKNGLRYIANFDSVNPQKPLLICIHGNSSCAETFWMILECLQNYKGTENTETQIRSIQAVSVDLPGCGKSVRLPTYSMDIIGSYVKDFIESFGVDRIYLFGHSLGGHLLEFIDTTVSGYAVSGTPPLSSASDFPNAFTPQGTALALLPLLSKEDEFTLNEATDFVAHTGIKGRILELMIRHAINTDGKFRKGCLSTLACRDQKTHLETLKNVVIFHATNDGVINKDYLESIDKSCLFQKKIHYIDCQHMAPLIRPQEITDVLVQAFNL